MKILLVGITNVGKTAIGSILAQKLGYEFYDVDQEIKQRYNMTMDKFMEIYSDFKKRHHFVCEVLKDLLNEHDNCVIAVRPLNYQEKFIDFINEKDVIAIDLRDTPAHIFERLVFSDSNDNLYTDDEYKNRYKQHYLNEITEDIHYYDKIYDCVQSKYFINNRSIEECADELADWIIHKKPIKPLMPIETIGEEILCSWHREISYLNIVEYDFLHINPSTSEYSLMGELELSYIYIQLPTGEDYDDLQTLENFISTLTDEYQIKQLTEARNALDHDYYEDIERLHLEKEWQEYNDREFKQFIFDWCQKNNLSYNDKYIIL